MVNSRIAVTGGSGFLGQATILAAENAGYDVWAFDRSEGNDVLGDLSALEGAGAVIHLAGVLGTSELFDTPELAIDVNIKGTLRILNWCRENGAQYVGITMLPVFPSVYTATKVCSQRLATAWHQAYGVPVSHVRAFNAYGSKQAYGHGHPQKIVPTFAVAGWNNRPLPIWGEGTQTIDLVHSDDVGRMLVDASRFGNDEVFDAGTGVSVTVNELAEFVLRVTGSTAGVEYLPMRLGEKATDVVAEMNGWGQLDWSPKLDWDSLADTIEAYRHVS